MPSDGGTRAVVDVVLQRPAADFRSASPADLRQDDDDAKDRRSGPTRHRGLHVQGDECARRSRHQDLPASTTYAVLSNLYNNRTVALATGRGLDGRTVARGRRAEGTSGKRRAASRNRRLERRRRGRVLRGARVQARLGRRTGGQTGKPTAQIEPKYA